ncbi:uncharacterized protein B0I36DRAFT_320032, partial [Microdochium trichocladiopsis]
MTSSSRSIRDPPRQCPLVCHVVLLQAWRLRSHKTHPWTDARAEQFLAFGGDACSARSTKEHCAASKLHHLENECYGLPPDIQLRYFLLFPASRHVRSMLAPYLQLKMRAPQSHIPHDNRTQARSTTRGLSCYCWCSMNHDLVEAFICGHAELSIGDTAASLVTLKSGILGCRGVGLASGQRRI